MAILETPSLNREPTSSTERPPPAPARHITALDGLRGIAVAGVLLFHAGHLQGGFLGVDLFFVLSGFLITGILIREVHAKGSIGLKAFWIRRSRRLMPALFALLIGVALYTAIVADASTLARIRGDALATLFYVANWHSIVAGQSYWDIFSAPSPLEHTWSLAIEEQFYLVWPFVLWGLFRLKNMSLKALLAICLGLAAASEVALWMLYDPANSSRAYLGTDTRGVAILLGAALATAQAIWGPAMGRTGRRIIEVVAGLAVVGLVASWFLVSGQSSFLYRGGFLLTELLVLAILLCVTHPQEGLVARFLSLAPFVWLGLISYGVYLWHWPIFVLLNEDRMGFGGWELTILQISVSIALAVVSYVLLEMPIRRHGLPAGLPARVVVPAVFAVLLVVIIGASYGATRAGGDLATNGGSAVPTGYSTAPAGSTKVLVLGDSVGSSLGVATARVGAKNGVAAANGGVIGCNLLVDQFKLRRFSDNVSGKLPDCNASWKEAAANLKPDVSVVLLGGGTKSEAQIDGQWRNICDPVMQDAVRKELQSGVDDLLAAGGKVALVTTPHYNGQKEEGKAWVDCLNTAITSVAKASPRTTVVDLDAWLCPGGKCRRTDGDVNIREDGLHFRNAGGDLVANWILTQLPKR